MTAAAGGDGAALARAALARHDWAAAYDLARRAVDTAAGGDPVAEADRLDTLAEAAWWVGHLDECITAREQAYARYDAAGANRQAGLCAIWLYTHWSFKARRAIASAWLRRAHRALDDELGCREYGRLLLYEAELAHSTGELDRAGGLVRDAIELGRQLRDADLEAQALQAAGRLLIDQGRPAEGLAHLDEAMLFALEDRLSPYVTGKVYCSLISACHELGDIRRAQEWTEAVSSWADSHPFTIFPGLCRLHRADLLKWRGDWDGAEAEARRACTELESIFVPNAGAAFAELGEIRRRRGDFAGAEEAFARAEALDAHPSAGLALLRLAQGRADVASTVIAEALREASWSALARAWLLPVEVEVAVARGELDRAAAASRELTDTAARYDSPVLLAAAATASGRVALAAGDPAACAALRTAVRRWVELDVPYEVATARLLLGAAYRDAGDVDGAVASVRAAEALFDRLGAVADRDAARRQLERRALPCGLSEREAEVLRLVAVGNTNRQIADALCLSDKTVARHLSNIFTKLGVSSRVAATAFAFEHDLVAR